MLIRKYKTFLYLLLFLFLFQSEGISAEDIVYRDLIDRGIATYEDGCRAISCFTDLSEGEMEFDELVLELKKRGIVGKRWDYEAERPLTRGVISYMACKTLKIRGGLTMRVIDITNRFTNLISKKLKAKDGIALPDIGMYKRYAYLEFQDMGTMPGGNKGKYLTGHDLLAFMYRIEQYIKAQEIREKQGEEKRKKREERKEESEQVKQ